MFRNKEYILTVFREGSFSKAAERLYISQPSLSASVKRIEEKLRAPIFDRSTTPISLTEIGREYVKYAMEIDEKEQDFTRFIEDHVNLLSGTIRIGGSSLFASFLLPQMISDFNKLYPEICFEISEDSTKNLIQKISDGTLDLVIDNAKIEQENIISSVYCPEILLLAVPQDFKVNDALKNFCFSASDIKEKKHINSDKTVSLKSFKDEPFILLNPENDTGMRADRLFEKYGITPNVIFHLDQQVTAYNISCSQMGISFVSDTLVSHAEGKPPLCFYKLTDSETVRNIFFYTKNNHYLSLACRKFLERNISS
ncbi:MAG: LysR family transcriptional regulator [Clostridia bacterium]|nr:LysR family transcriptional regulator [Clostridia bacterium]